MAFMFADSFEGYDERVHLNERGWALSTGSTAGQISTGTFKDGTRSYAPTQGIDYMQFQGTAIPIQDKMWISFWFRYEHDATVTSSVVEWLIGTGGTRYWGLFLNTDETLQFYENTVPRGLKSVSLIRDKWYHFECKFRQNDSISAGDCEVRVDGVTMVTLDAGTDTYNSGLGAAEMSGYAIVASGSGPQFYDSWIAWGDDVVAGDPFNDWMGRLRIGIIRPNGNGNDSDLLGSDADKTDNYLLVDDGPGFHDDDTTYLESDTLNEKDTWQYEDLAGLTITSIPLVQIVSVAEKTQPADRRVTPLVRTGGTTFSNVTEHQLVQDTYNTYLAQWFLNPDTAAEFTESEINAAEFGIEVTT